MIKHLKMVIFMALTFFNSLLFARSQPPNVILIMTDDQGYGDLACNGNPYLETPNIDLLSRESVNLTNFHVNTVCAPTRAALMTGRFSFRTGITSTTGGESLMRRDEVTMAQVFASSGYRTGMFGKWHLGDNYPFRPEYRGFEEVVAHGGGGITQTPDCWDNSYFNDRYYHNGEPQQYSGYCTDVWFQEAQRFISQDMNKPFFAYIATNAPHAPFSVEEKYSKPYREKGIPHGVANFYGMISNVDENVGKLREWLHDNKLEDNTILIFMTDNGSVIADRRNGRAGKVFDFNGYNAGMRGGKGSQYEGGHRVPCYIYWPKGNLTGGRQVTQLTAHIDLLPTLIEICELGKPDATLDGKNILPLLSGSVSGWKDRMIVVTRGDRIGEKNFTVLSENWRLVDGPGEEINKELYAIKSDSAQMHNVANKYPELVEEMWRYLQSVCKEEKTKLEMDVPIVIGNEKETPARLTSHDWRQTAEDKEFARKQEYLRTGTMPKVVDLPWNQYLIRDQAPLVNGYFVVDVEEGGSYEFILRQQPAEAKFPLEAVRARLQIGEVDITKDVPIEWESNFSYEYWNCSSGVRFVVDLEAGRSLLRTWLINKDGSSRGAYYVYVRRLPYCSKEYK